MSTTEIHPTACIDPSSSIGAGCKIGPFVVIEADTVLGEGCQVSAHAVIKQYSILGKQNQLLEGVVIGGLPQDFKFKDQQSFVRIGDRNTFREYVTVNRSTGEQAATVVGDDCLLMAYAHVAHECEIGNRVVMANTVQLAGHITILDDAFVAGCAGIHQFCRVGERSMIGGYAKVERDVPPYCLVDGVPARLRGLNLVALRRAGTRPEVLESLKQAYRILCLKVSQAERLSRLDQLESREARQITDFIRHSQRGYCRPRD